MAIPRRRALALALLLVLPATWSPLAATCGGGGGGGMGGISGGGGGGGRPATYQVPWQVMRTATAPAAPGGANGVNGETSSATPGGQPALVLYWFPVSAAYARTSELQGSRSLTLAAARCVALDLVTTDNAALHEQFAVKGETVVLATPDGKELSRLSDADGHAPSVGQVEKLLDSQLKGREDALNRQLDEARDKEKKGDAEGAVTLYGTVYSERCLFPGLGKKAAKALKKLGRPVAEDRTSSLLDFGAPILAEPTASRVARTMDAGLAAENDGRYLKARALYRRAAQLDPADPVPLRYLGELERHHTGDWAAAHRLFERLLAMPADPISRAVALHGLGKMTIHDGQFAKGLSLIERSVATYPIPLAYRNLAVYWNSEGQVDKARGFAAQALALEPDDPYNQIFFAAFAAEDGKREEALRVASQNEDLLAASYNLAAIHSLLGHRDKALALLGRHFFTYERYPAVRAKEMKEAREDIVFTMLKDDPAFVALTAQAEKPKPAAPTMPSTSAKAGRVR
jgi:tetratricopeptide (TPR) repeat protein